MKEDLIRILCCPLCKSDLTLEVKEGDRSNVLLGNFRCDSCKNSYEINQDIPYFKPSIEHKGIKNQFITYSHWFEEMHDDDSITNLENREFFYESLRIDSEIFKNKIVLDAGCGNGRFSYVTSSYKPKLLVSFDLSTGLGKAKEAIKRNYPDANIAFVQGDITTPPFKKEVFDIIYSWGVIHHTPNTKSTFNTIASLVKDKGIFGIYVYVFNPNYEYDQQIKGLLAYLRSFLLIRPFRFICSRLPVSLVKLVFLPIFYFERMFGVGIFGNHGYPDDPFNKDRYFRVVVDRFKTRYASEHKEEEIFQWFFEQGFNNLKVGKPKVSISGIRNKIPHQQKNITYYP